MENFFRRGFSFFLFFLSLVWVKSGYGKITSYNFVSSLASTLAKFFSKNPFNWYKTLIINYFIPNATVLGFTIEWAELLCGLIMGFAAIYFLFAKNANKFLLFLLGLALFGSFLLSLNFWLAASWTSSSTDSLNLLMMLFELSGFLLLIPTLLSKRNVKES